MWLGLIFTIAVFGTGFRWGKQSFLLRKALKIGCAKNHDCMIKKRNK